MLPSHHTKQLNSLEYHFNHYTFQLEQQQDGTSNGTCLWLGGQVLAYYLLEYHTKFKQLHALELGSGVGLTALALSSLGWNVTATDHATLQLLSRNIAVNQVNLPGPIRVKHLDWIAPLPEDLAPTSLIITADTIYAPELVTPLLRTLHTLSLTSAPTILLCLERRDPILVDRFLKEASQDWNFNVARIPHRKLANAIRKSGVNWPSEEWQGVELWKLRIKTS